MGRPASQTRAARSSSAPGETTGSAAGKDGKWLRDWTLLGREQQLGATTFIVRSCPFCQLEGYGDAAEPAALDKLREWALRHPLRCLAHPLQDTGRDRGHGRSLTGETLPDIEATSY